MTTVAAERGDSSAGPSTDTRPPDASSSGARPPDTRTPSVIGAPDSKAAEQSEASASEESAVAEAAAVLPQVLKIVGAVVAPTTLLTALMYYFGRQWAHGWFGYFGVEYTVLDLTVQDYLIRSADGLILPMVGVALATLLALWVHQLQLASPADTRRIVQRVLMPSSTIAGLVLVSLALADVVDPVFPATFPEGRGLSLTIGVLLLAYAARLLRLLTAKRRPELLARQTPGATAVAEWGAIFVLVSIGLFWAVGDYANLVGTGRAEQLEALLPSYPNVAAYSEKRLSLQAPGIQEVACQYPDAAYRFRYEGLKLVMQSGNQYLFLPAVWTHANGAAILLPRSESLRLEFSPPGEVRSATC